MPTSYKVTRKPEKNKEKKKENKTTAKDLPGSGMARQAGDAIETRRAKQKELMRKLTGGS